MLYLKEGDLYKNVRMLTETVKSPFYGGIYLLRRGDVEDTWTLSPYDEDNDKILSGSNYISDISHDDMSLLINDDTVLEYYRPANSILVKPKKRELDICVGDLVEFYENSSYGYVTDVYKNIDDFVYVLSVPSPFTTTKIVKREEIKKVYKKVN